MFVCYLYTCPSRKIQRKRRKQFVIFFCFFFWEHWNFLEILASSVLNSRSNLSFSKTVDSKKIPWSLEFEPLFEWEQVWNFAKETKEFVRFCLERNRGALQILGFLSKVSNHIDFRNIDFWKCFWRNFLFANWKINGDCFFLNWMWWSVIQKYKLLWYFYKKI